MNWGGMNVTQKDILKTTIAAYKENTQTLADRERLKQAERVGPKCAEKTHHNKASV